MLHQIGNVTLLAFVQHVLEESPVGGVYITHHEPYLPIVPDDFHCLATGTGAGQDFYLWADEPGAVLYVVMPGLGIFAAVWHPADDEHLEYNPALGVLAAAF